MRRQRETPQVYHLGLTVSITIGVNADHQWSVLITSPPLDPVLYTGLATAADAIDLALDRAAPRLEQAAAKAAATVRRSGG